MVQHAYAGGVVTTEVGDALGFLRQGLPTFERAAVSEFGAQGRQDECSFRNAGLAALMRAVSSTSTFSLSVAPTAL